MQKVPICVLRYVGTFYYCIKGIDLETVMYILAKVVDVYLDLASFAILVRVILPFFTNADESSLYGLSVLVSEPCIIPFRVISDKFGIWQDTPLDMPLMMGVISLSLLSFILPVI